MFKTQRRVDGTASAASWENICGYFGSPRMFKNKVKIKVKYVTVTCVVPVLFAALGAPPGGGGD